MYYKYSFWGAFVKENLNLLSDFYNRLIIKSVGDGQKRSGAFRVEKYRFSGREVPLFGSRSAAS